MNYNFEDLKDLENQLHQLEECYDSVKIAIEDVMPGVYLKDDIYSNNRLLWSAQVPLNEKVISYLKKKGVKEIEISLKDKKPPQWDQDVNPTVDQGTCDIIKQYLENSLNHETIENLKNASEKVIQQILATDKFIYSLAEYNKEDRNSFSSHAFHTCIYSLVLAKAYNRMAAKDCQIDYESLALAALLHDIGKKCRDDSVRSTIKLLKGFGDEYPELLEDAQKKAIENYNPKYDPYYGFSMLFSYNQISSSTRAMIFFSRENERGTGPFHYKKMKNATNNIAKISPNLIGAEIINLCSAFDKELCNNMREEVTLEKMQEFVSILATTKYFNLQLIELLLKNIPLYPFGTRVHLGGNTDTYGVVIKNFKSLKEYHRPVVLTIPSNINIDLREEESTTIDQICGKEIHFSDFYMNTSTLDEEAPKR